MQIPQPNDNSPPDSKKPVEQIHVHFKGSREIAGKCKQDPQKHIFSFDRTTMSGVEMQITHFWYNAPEPPVLLYGQFFVWLRGI